MTKYTGERRPVARDVLETLRGLDIPPTQMENLERLLTRTMAQDQRPLGDLVERLRDTEACLSGAERAWLNSCQVVAERIKSTVEEAAKRLEEELFWELISEKNRP